MRHLGKSLHHCACLAGAMLCFAALASAANPAPHQELAKARLRENYGKLPLSFEENRGQADARVKFLSRGSGYSLFLTPGAVLMNLDQPQQDKHASLRMSFPGARRSAGITGDRPQSTISSYFLGNDSSQWITGVPNYSGVRYRGLYPGVDLLLYGDQGRLEYDFVVAPGANPKVIHLAFDGARRMRLDDAGDLVLTTALGEIREHKPIVYQDVNGARRNISGHYVIGHDGCVGFEVASYDSRRPLIIDPVLSYMTYLGSPGVESFNGNYPAIAVDSQGNAYVTGQNGGSTNFGPSGATMLPPPPGGTGGGGTEVFVTKFNPSGTAVIYSVVFGGGGQDVGGGIAVDGSGNAYITGTTSSINFPVSAGAPQGVINGNTNAFVTKVNSSGTALVYSTYLGVGGDLYVQGNAIALDAAGNAYVTGAANSTLATYNGFLTKVNSAGTQFVYSNSLSTGIGYGITADSAGNTFVAGAVGPRVNGFALSVNPSGSAFNYGPVVIGAASTAAYGIAVDSSDNAYITGFTGDPHIATPGAAQAVYGGGLADGFAAKLSWPAGTIEWATYVGGAGSALEQGSGIGVDSSGNVYVGGTTQCIGFPQESAIYNPQALPAALLVSANHGASWSPEGSLTPGANGIGLFDRVNAVAFDPVNPASIIYVGASAFNGPSGSGGIYKSTNGGASWALSNTGIASTTIDAIAVDPANGQILYAVANEEIYKSTNGGENWTSLNQVVGTSGSVAVNPSNANIVYVGSSTGLLVSSNAGTSWTPIAGVPAPVNAVVVDASGNYYAANNAGVYKNGSASSSGLPASTVVSSLAINRTSPNILYAATATPGVLYQTTNSGGTWTPVSLGPEEPEPPLLVAVDPSNPSNLYVALQVSGVLASTDGGSSWSALAYAGLTHNQATALVVQPSTGTVLTGIVVAADAFVAKLNSTGSAFLYSTCIGGNDNDYGQRIAVTPGGAVYLSGATVSSDLPVSANAYQRTLAGSYDAFVAAFDLSLQITSPTPGETLSGSLADFMWNPVAGAAAYELTVGTTPGGTNIFSGITSGTSQDVTFIPCTGSTIYVQLSTEINGIFEPAGTSSYPCKSAIGDFNGDGHQDLLWQNNSSGQVNVNYYGGAGPQAQGSTVLNNGTTLAGWRLVGAGDFDHNGTPDLVYQNTTSGQVNVNYYSGTTMIGSACLSCGINTTEWKLVAVADFDGNGTPDLVYQNIQTHQVNVDYYSGATFIGYACLSCGLNLTNWQVVAAADFDGNGTPDLVYQNTVTHQVNVDYYGGTGGATLISFACLSCGINTTGWQVVGAADWNADGVPDLVYQNTQTGQVNVDYYGGGGGAVLKSYNCLNCGSIPVNSLVRAVGKFGSSGEQALVYQSTTNNAVTAYFYAFGGAVFESSACVSCGINTTSWKLVGTGDFDGNGTPDLVYQNVQTHQVNVDYYSGTSFIGYACLSCGLNLTDWEVVAVADFNGDGVPDLVYQNTATHQVNVDYYGGSGGAGVIGYACLSCGINTTDWQVKAAADFDGNGVPDLVYQNTQTGQVNVDYYGGTAGASLIGYACLSCGLNLTNWQLVGAADFDGNGVPDLVYQNKQTGQVNVDYYGGPRGAVLQGSNVLSTGNPGWSVVVPRSR